MLQTAPTPRLAGTTRADLCPVVETIDIIGKKWYLIILHELTAAPQGFNELRRSVRGISAKVLSESLRHLERKRLVTRRVHSASPIRVEYALTERGAELAHLFEAMKAWGEKWQVCADSGVPNARFAPAPGAPRAGRGPVEGSMGPAETGPA